MQGRLKSYKKIKNLKSTPLFCSFMEVNEPSNIHINILALVILKLIFAVISTEPHCMARAS